MTGNNTGQNGSITFNVSTNTIQGARGTAPAVNKLGGTGTFSGTIANNIVGVAGVQGSGSLEGSGIFVLSEGGGALWLFAPTDCPPSVPPPIRYHARLRPTQRDESQS